MGFRTILLILAIWAIFMILRYQWRNKQKIRTQKRQEKMPQEMVKCKYCGVHIPKTEALESNENYYCSTAHLKQADSYQNSRYKE